MTIREALKKYYRIEIELLLPYVLKKPKEFLFLHPEHQLSPKHLNILSRLVKRRQKGEPMAYILGYKDFYGLRFKVNKNVLIPRPETEELVNKVCRACKVYKGKETFKILDIGAGSGNIIVSLAKNLKGNYKFFSSDVSFAALKIAKQNAKIHHAKIKFIHSNLFQSIPSEFDIIIANLPYVSKKVYESKIKNLEWEPKIALTDGTNKFVLYEKFFQQIAQHLNQDAIIYLEIDPRSKMALTSWQKKYLPGWKIKFYKDLNNFWRYAKIN